MQTTDRLIATVLLMFAGVGWGQTDDGPLVTDRPDFTESALAVPTGRAQLEMGLTLTGIGSESASLTAPEALLRVGLTGGLELRIGAPSFAWMDDGSLDASGVTDMGVGFKLELSEQSGPAPSLAVIGEASFPTGSDAFSGDRTAPAVILAWAYDLGDSGLALAGNFGVTSLEDGSGDRFEEFASSLALGIPLTDELAMFTECFGFYRNGDSAGPEHYFNTGLTHLLDNNTQLDFRVGLGLNGRADDWFTGAGVSFRF